MVVAHSSIQAQADKYPAADSPFPMLMDKRAAAADSPFPMSVDKGAAAADSRVPVWASRDRTPAVSADILAEVALQVLPF